MIDHHIQEFRTIMSSFTSANRMAEVSSLLATPSEDNTAKVLVIVADLLSENVSMKQKMKRRRKVQKKKVIDLERQIVETREESEARLKYAYDLQSAYQGRQKIMRDEITSLKDQRSALRARASVLNLGTVVTRGQVETVTASAAVAKEYNEQRIQEPTDQVDKCQDRLEQGQGKTSVLDSDKEVEDDESAEDDDSTEDDEKKWRYQWLQAQSWLNCEKESTPVIHPNEENREEEDEEEEGEGEDEDEEEQEEEEEGERGVYYPPYYPPGHDARGTTVSTNMASHRHAVCPPYKQPGDEMICVDPSTGEEHVIIIPEGVYTGDKFDVCL